jgi:hypothetical protein
MHKQSKELAGRGLDELDYTFGDFFMPVVICGTAGALGCLADGAAAVLPSNAPPHNHTLRRFKTLPLPWHLQPICGTPDITISLSDSTMLSWTSQMQQTTPRS